MATRKNAVRDNRKRVWSNLYRFGACIYVTPRWVFTIAADVRFSEVSLQDLALPGPVPEKRPSRHPVRSRSYSGRSYSPRSGMHLCSQRAPARAEWGSWGVWTAEYDPCHRIIGILYLPKQILTRVNQTVPSYGAHRLRS